MEIKETIGKFLEFASADLGFSRDMMSKVPELIDKFESNINGGSILDQFGYILKFDSYISCKMAVDKLIVISQIVWVIIKIGNKFGYVSESFLDKNQILIPYVIKEETVSNIPVVASAAIEAVVSDPILETVSEKKDIITEEIENVQFE